MNAFISIGSLAIGLAAVSGCAGVGTAGVVGRTAPPAPISTVSPLTMAPLRTQIQADLARTWQGYKQDFIQGDGRVVDHGRNGVTTSEGESYALLRSAWTDDRPEFDLVWAWTRHNLQVRNDALFGYLWGRQSNGSWSILSKHSATDADEDIALALVFAYHRWHDPGYLSAAKRVIRDVWVHEVTTVHGEAVITAGDWSPSVRTPGPQIDPSYFAPYAYRIFAPLDRAHPWHQIVTSSYHVLTLCTTSPLGGSKSADLAPNWCSLTGNGQVAKAHESRAGLYGYDAFRAPWRIALDYLWNGEPRALQYLRRQTFLRTAWSQSHHLFSEYYHNGKPASTRQDPTIYGGDLGNFIVAAPAEAVRIALQKLLPTLKTQDGVAYWDQRFNYYEQNWVWFGLAMIADRLPNLAAPASSVTATPRVPTSADNRPHR